MFYDGPCLSSIFNVLFELEESTRLQKCFMMVPVDSLD